MFDRHIQPAPSTSRQFKCLGDSGSLLPQTGVGKMDVQTNTSAQTGAGAFILRTKISFQVSANKCRTYTETTKPLGLR